MSYKKTPTSFKQKVLLITFGLFIAFLIVEILFRIAGFVVFELKSKFYVKDDKVYSRILCLGDSSTFGVGASNLNKYSYPSQLQKILDEKNPNVNFQVINKGIPGLNSSQLVNRFRGNILKYKPDVVVVQIGANDEWNFEESNIMKYYNGNIRKKILLGTELILSYSRIFKFLKLVFLSLDPTGYVERKQPEIRKTSDIDFGFSLRNPGKKFALLYPINENLTKIVKIANDYKINVIFMRYHVGGNRSPYFYQQQVFQQLNVPYVNNRTLFEEAKHRGINPFGPDKWHPSDEGYMLIAKNVYNKMVELGLLTSEPIDIFEERP